jgi:hypothetical protein
VFYSAAVLNMIVCVLLGSSSEHDSMCFIMIVFVLLGSSSELDSMCFTRQQL